MRGECGIKTCAFACPLFLLRGDDSAGNNICALAWPLFLLRSDPGVQAGLRVLVPRLWPPLVLASGCAHALTANLSKTQHSLQP